MMNKPVSDPIPLKVREQAAEWLIELQSDSVTSETHERWQQWIDENVAHDKAWKKIETFSTKIQILSPPLAHAALDAPESESRRKAVKTLAVLFFAGASAWYVEKENWMSDYHTVKGERRTVMLNDGSQLTLNSETSLNVYFNETQRLIKLIKGEILITTGHVVKGGFNNNLPPFYVQTYQGEIRALGTRFSVRQFETPDQTQVSVAEGVVEIQPLLRGAEAVLLEAGQKAIFSGVSVSATEPVSLNSTAWASGLIVAEDMPLVEFLAELNRYHEDTLKCEPSVASVKVSGTYPLSNTQLIIATLETTYPLKMTRVVKWFRANELVFGSE